MKGRGGEDSSAGRRILVLALLSAVGLLVLHPALPGEALRPRRIRRLDRIDLPVIADALTPVPPPPVSPPPVVFTPPPSPPAPEPSPPPPPVTDPLPVPPLEAVTELPIVCEGDRVRFLDGGRRIVGEGNVRIEYRGMLLRADRAEVDVPGRKAVAEGNVVFHEEDQYLYADRLSLDLATREVEISPGRGYFPPLYGGAEEIKARGREYVELNKGHFTTCDLDDPHYHLSSRRVEIYPGDRIIARSSTVYWGRVPVFWIPYYWRSLKEDCSGFIFRPGYRDSWGFFVLSGYQLCLPGLRAALNLDWRRRRGPAYGLEGDFLPWRRARGDWQLYYAPDRLFPGRDRYLAEMSYRQSWPRGISGSFALNYAGDPDFRREFFRSQYDASRQPPSFLYLSKTWPEATLSLDAQFRVNKFEGVTERLPEARLQTRQQQLGETNFYYELDTSLTNFQKRFPDLGSTQEESVRFDTFQNLSYNRKFWGWLNFIPNVGIRQSYYSRGPGVEEDGEEKTETPEGRDLLRRIFSTGLGLSTAIYGVYPTRIEALDINQLRHVIEPSLDYVFVDHPTLRRDRHFHYDAVERIGPANFTRVGLRNLLQTKRTIEGGEQSWTLADLLLQTNLYTDPDKYNFGRLIDDLSAQLRFNPVARAGMRLDVRYDTYDGLINESTLGVWAGSEDDWRMNLNHAYRRDRGRDSLDATVFLRAGPKWAFEIFGRYDFADSRFEEEAITVHRDLHCWETSLTLRRREGRDETEIFFTLWVKAFPQAGLRLSN